MIMAKVKPRTTAYDEWTHTLVQEKKPARALQIFNNRKSKISGFAYDVIIQKLGSAKMFEEIENVLDQMRKEDGLKCKEGLLCSVIKLYGRARKPEAAMELFDKMPKFGYPKPSIRFFNTLFNALLNSKRFDLLQSVYKTMSISPDTCTYNILLKAHCNGNRLEDARELFDKMPEPSLVTYGTLINALCENMDVNQAFQLFNDMTKKKGLCPNVHIYTALMGGLCNLGKVDEALKLKTEMERNGMKPDTVTYTTLINGLFKVGRSEEVGKMLEEMNDNGCVLHVATYNTFITYLCKDGNFEGAFGFLDTMKCIFGKQDIVSCNIIVSGLCREGKIKEAYDFFENMPSRGCEPTVVTYRLMLDGFCGAGKFKEAAMFLESMVPKGFIPRRISVSEVISGLCKEGKIDWASSVLRNMAKECLVELSAWDAVVPYVCSKTEQQKASELLNRIVCIP